MLPVFICRKIVKSSSTRHDADVEGLDVGYKEQYPGKIFAGLSSCMRDLQKSHPRELAHVEHVAVCGQMHGCVLWSSKNLEDYMRVLEEGSMQNTVEVFSSASHLITWQDKRLEKQEIEKLPLPE